MAHNPPIQIVASGDSRPGANRRCWPAQQALEKMVQGVLNDLGHETHRAHEPDPTAGHGFIDSQARGLEVFRQIDPQLPIVVATAVWQYTSHVLAGLIRHKGPILTLANWSGEWPGLVGLLNLNGSLTKANVSYSSVWSENFQDDFAKRGLSEWLTHGHITHDVSHVRPLDEYQWPVEAQEFAARGRAVGSHLRADQALLGVFDEGCMGMFNAIIPDQLLHRLGLFKERLSQSALYAAMRDVKTETAHVHYKWLLERGMQFRLGPDSSEHLTEDQVLEGLKMYTAAATLADRFGCSAIGIQYQQGLKDLCVASDLAEGLLNNPDRPPVVGANGRPVFEGQAIPHFNEVDECAGVDALMTNRVWMALGFDPSTTLHDVRWGEVVRNHGVNEFVWVFEISGAAPASHFINGYAGAVGERQPPMYFPRGGSTLKGVSKPGEIVWSRIYVERNALHMDIGRGGVVRLPDEETERRWQLTTPQWPIMHAVLYGVSRNQLMAKHQSNHIQVAYAPNAVDAHRALVMKSAMAQELGFRVNLCGDLDDDLSQHQATEFQQ